MAAVRLLLSQARRHCHCLSRSTSLLRPSSSIPYSKPFSSSSPESPPPPPEENPSESPGRQSVSIQPVSYAAKPKQEQPPSPEAGPPEDAQRRPPPQRPRGPADSQARSSWTREDVRYMRDAAAPGIAPVSYPARVAPLPEDKAPEEEGKETTPDEGRETGMPRRRIERDGGMMMRRRRPGKMFEEIEEREKLPFPAPIKVVKNERKPVYDLNEALQLVKDNAKSNFDETIEAHVRLGIDRKRSDLIVRGSMLLPHGEGMKVSKIAFLGEGAEAEEARAAGADIVGGLELVQEIANSGGKFAVQKCFTTPAFMPNVLKIAKVLKPLGLLPNAKQGTLVSNVTQAVKEAKQSNVDFRMDKTSIVHVGLGKVSLSEAYLRENIGAFVNALLRAKPAGLKKASKFAGYVDAFHICSTMGPGFAVSIQSLSKAADNYSKAHLIS